MKWKKLIKWKELIELEDVFFISSFIFLFLLVIAQILKADLIVNIMMSIAIGIMILFLLFMGFIMCGLFYAVLTSEKYPTTDISRYPKALAYFGEYTKHFPRDIPIEAKDIIFYYSMGLLQGGSEIQLRMKLDPKQIAEIQTLFRQNAKLKYIPGSENNSLKYETIPGGTSICHHYVFHTGDTLEYDFPEHYEILVLEDDRGAPRYKYSRAVSYGIAIDIKTSEVIYWGQIGGG